MAYPRFRIASGLQLAELGFERLEAALRRESCIRIECASSDRAALMTAAVAA